MNCYVQENQTTKAHERSEANINLVKKRGIKESAWINHIKKQKKQAFIQVHTNQKKRKIKQEIISLSKIH